MSPGSLNMRRNLVLIYVGILVAVFLSILLIPASVGQGRPLIEYDFFVELLILALMVASIVIYKLYQHELSQTQSRLRDITRYVGALNLQTEQIESMLDELKHLPTSKKDMRRAVTMLANTILGAVRADWVELSVYRDGNTDSSLELTLMRAGVNHKAEPSLSDLVRVKDFHVKSVCRLPLDSLSYHQEVVIHVALTNLCMLYSIYISRCHPETASTMQKTEQEKKTTEPLSPSPLTSGMLATQPELVI